MAVSSIVITPDAARDAKARILAPQVGSWPKHTLKQPHGSFEAGTVFRRATGSNGERYLVNSVACQCPDYVKAENVCKHIRAVALWEQEQEIDAAIAEAFVRLVDMRIAFPPCAAGCGAITEGSAFCDDCSAKRARDERMAAARRRVIEAWI